MIETPQGRQNPQTPAETGQKASVAPDFGAMLKNNKVDVAAAMKAAGMQPSDTGTGNMTVRVRQAPSAAVSWARQATMPIGSSGSGGTWTGEVDPSDGMLQKAAPYMDIIRDASSVYGVPVNVIMAVIKAESDYQPRCLSHSGAMGLMQIMPENAEYYGVTNAYDARQNIMCGTEEIARHLRSYNGDLRLALVAYNTGPGNVARRGVTSSSSAAYTSIPASVREYADRVMRYAGLAS